MSNEMAATCKDPDCSGEMHELTAWIEDAEGYQVGVIARCLTCEGVFEYER